MTFLAISFMYKHLGFVKYIGIFLRQVQIDEHCQIQNVSCVSFVTNNILEFSMGILQIEPPI